MTEKKSQADLEIEALADVFGIATTGFEDYYKTCKEKSKGIDSTAASSGYNSKAASSGENSKAASSGNYSKAASSGENSTAASSGNYSTAASSGYNSKAASSGENSTAASSGNYSKAASSGENSTAASSGNYSTAASSGENSGTIAVGYRAAVKGDLGNLLMSSEYVIKDDKYIPVGGKADLVDGKKIKPNCWYIVNNDKWVEVDFTDDVFTYVISTKNGVKKVKTESGKILFVVNDDKGNSAHGETIAKAREDLIYKVVAKFDGDLPKKATGVEWVGIYRALTGACAAGVKNFVESTGKNLDETYTAAQVAKIIKGQYGADKFSQKMKD